MKRVLSALIAAVLVLSMIPVAYAAESEIIASGTDVAATVAQPVTYTWTPATNGTLTVTMGAASPGWRFTISDAEGNTIGLPKTGKTEKSNDFELVGGTQYTFSATGFNSSTWDTTSANITYTLSFVSSEDTGGEVEKAEYEISNTALVIGDNNLTLLETAVTTIYVYEPSETGVFTFTAPEGTILGYWGAGSWFLNNPNSTTNTYEWTCTGVGQSAYIGISGVEGTFNLNIAKTGDYTVVETPIVVYENKATLEAFTLPEGSTLGGYIDITAETTHTAVLGDDGYYHLNSADGDIILVDMDYQDIVLTDALRSDRPVMYAYMKDEDGNQFKYDIGAAVQEYEAVMDENGYYPLTEDLILFYDVYANGVAVYSFYVTGNYNQENVWMYCMRTVTFPEDTETTEPEVTEPEVTEPEVTEPEVTEPEVTEPEVTEPEVTEPEVTEPVETDPPEVQPEVSAPAGSEIIAQGTGIFVEADGAVKYTWTASAKGTLTVTIRAAAPGWRYEITDAAGNTIGLPKTGKSLASATFDLEADTTYTFSATGWDSENQSNTVSNISYVLSFVASEGEEEIEKVEREVSTVMLAVGDNTLTLSENATYTLYRFRPTEAGTYLITAPEGAIVGNWGATTNYLVNPNSTSNSCYWTCASVGQSAYIGITGVDGEFVVTIVASEAPEPEVTEPEATEPEVTEPEVTEPEVTEPEVSEPETSDPNVPAGTTYAITENGSTAYYSNSTIHTAINAISGSAEVILYQDIDLSTNYITISATQTITLNLNGCTLSNKKSSGGVISVAGGTLTITDSSAQGDGLINNTSTSSDRGIVISSSGNLIVKGGNITTKTQGIRIDKGSLTFENGTVTATNYAIYIGASGVATINGGVFTSGVGTFYYPLYAANGATVSITGGYCNGNIPGGSGMAGSISGGYYIAQPNSSHIADGCTVESNNDTVYLYKVVDPNAVPEEPIEPEKLVDEWNLVLDDDLLVNFYLNLADDAQVQISIGSNSVTYSASVLETNADGKYIASVRLSAAQMTDSITLQLVGSDAEAVSYTVRQYADVILADSTQSAYHSLIKELLSYGAAAQTYFSYNTDNLADSNITGTAANDIPAETDEIVVSGRISDVKYAGATLVYRDKIAVRLYFTGDMTGLTFTANGNTYTPVAKDDMYYVEIADILPQNLDQQITLTVSDADGNTLSVSYGPMNYIVRMSTKGSDNLKALLKALYNYHLAAKYLRAA